MKTTFICAIALLCVSASALRAETPAELEILGATALKLSQSEPDAIVSAAINYGKASDAYEKAGDEFKATEMNSFLYWCKKKMTFKQMDIFLKGDTPEQAATAKRLKALDSSAPAANEAKNYFDRAEKYAQAHPDEHLLIAIRYFEVADRFKGTDASLQAQDRSLKEMMLGQNRSDAKKIVAGVAPVGNV